MAIAVNTLSKPWIWMEAVAGGSLPIGNYYMIGFNAYIQQIGPYFGYVPGVASDEVSCTTTTGNQKIKMELYELGGYVTTYANAGGGLVTVTTSVAHGLANGDTVYLRGTANYTGAFVIANVTATTFDITAVWAVDDGASNWYKTPGLPTKPASITNDTCFYFKWDYYSMLRGDGSKIQWCNTNDPAVTNEWTYSGSYGHRNWGGDPYSIGVKETNLTTAGDGSKYKYFDGVTVNPISYPNWNTTKFYTGGVNSTWLSSQTWGHPEIAMRKYSDAGGTVLVYALPNGMSETESAVLITIDNSNYLNTWDYLITAITNSGYIGKSMLLLRNNVSNVYYSNNQLIIRGCILMQNATFTTQLVWYNKYITLIKGILYCESGTNASTLLLNDCFLSFDTICSVNWLQPRFSATNSKVVVVKGSLFVDYLGVMTNVAFDSGFITYNSISGYTVIGYGYNNTNNIFCIRYPINNATVSEMKLYKCATSTYPTASGKTYTWTNVAYYQIQSDVIAATSAFYNFDIFHNDGFSANEVILHTWNCYNVTSNERANRLVRVKFSSKTTPGFNSTSTLIYKFHFPIDIKVIDETGNAISGADVVITNSNGTPDTYTTSTAVSGSITQQNIKCYTVEFDINNPDGYSQTSTSYKFFSKTTLLNNISITISKNGYETYSTILSGMLEARDMVVTLKTAKLIRLLIGDGAALALQAELGSSSLMKKI